MLTQVVHRSLRIEEKRGGMGNVLTASTIFEKISQSPDVANPAFDVSFRIVLEAAALTLEKSNCLGILPNIWLILLQTIFICCK